MVAPTKINGFDPLFLSRIVFMLIDNFGSVCT